MPLQFILGNSGSGKSHYLYQKMIGESIAHPECNYIVIVPEQFTMQTQKDLVMMHPDRGIMNIDVLSFRRLAHRIFEEVGTDRRTVLTETGKNLMLRKVAIEEAEHLQVLGGRMNRPGYISEVKSMLSELMQYEITDEALSELLAFSENRPLLHAKLSDIRRLYCAFLEYQRDRFKKPEELLDVLCQMAGKSQLLRKSTLAFDGFTGFTPSQMNVLRELLAVCPEVLVTVTIDVREPFYGEIQEHELFALSRRMIRNVSEAAREAAGRRKREAGKAMQDAAGQGMSKGYGPEAGNAQRSTVCDAAGQGCAENPAIREPVILGAGGSDVSGRQNGSCGSARFPDGGALFHLEQNLFRRKREVYAGVPEELSMHTATTPAQEVHFAARTICALVRSAGYRYQDIAVITGKLSAYDNYIKKIFPMYDVPAFLDETRHILLNPCLEFVRGALMVSEKEFSAESVFRYLRAGMSGLQPEEIDRLENYVLAAGIRGRGLWEQEWTCAPGKMTQEELDFCNECRLRVMRTLGPFSRRMHQDGALLKDYAEALYGLLEECGVQQMLKDRETALQNAGDREEAREYSQIYAILIGLLDEMVDLMGDECVSGREFAEILDAGFAEARVGIIPPGIDQVQVGDIERSRLAHVRVLFFLGLNDGWVPSRGEDGGIVSDMERELLAQTGVELAPSARENSYIQRFYLYQNLTKPKDRLYLSWCCGSGDGTAMRPSYLVAVLCRLFPKIQITQEQDAGDSVWQVTSKKNGMLYLTQGLEDVRSGRSDDAWLELYGQYLQDEQYRERVRVLVRAAFARGAKGRISYLTSKELYGESMTNSVTRLEQFASCAFAHFASYGLRLQERELHGIKPTDLGVIFHRAMELFSRRLLREDCDWSEIPLERQRTMMDQCIDVVAEEYGAGALHASAREAYTVNRMKRILSRTVWALHRQLCAGSFRPSGFEVSFADVGSLEAVNVRFGENGHIRLQGRIDRIDTAETEDTVYVKIIDYKSGMTQFDPVSLYYGLQLQLVVYLNAALEMERHLHEGKKIVPAGIFYYRMQDPVLDKEPGADAPQIEEKLLKKLRPDGVLNGDEEVLRLFDHRIGGDSLVIPAGLKKDGTLKKTAAAVTAEQLGQLSGFVSRKLAEMGARILDGETEVSPFADRSGSACDFCSYSDVCGFDRKIPGMHQKCAGIRSKEEAWEKIAQESGQTEGGKKSGGQMDGGTAEGN